MSNKSNRVYKTKKINKFGGKPKIQKESKKIFKNFLGVDIDDLGNVIKNRNKNNIKKRSSLFSLFRRRSRGGNFFELSKAALQKDTILRGIESFASPGDIERITKKMKSSNTQHQSPLLNKRNYNIKGKKYQSYHPNHHTQPRKKEQNDVKIPTVLSVAKVLTVLK
jgi:hypothetical protein